MSEGPRRFAAKGRRPVERMPDFHLAGDEIQSLTACLMAMRKDDSFPHKIDPAKSTP